VSEHVVDDGGVANCLGRYFCSSCICLLGN
jgi:hypothetical protein